jgi:two-component system, sensor histidine kinase
MSDDRTGIDIIESVRATIGSMIPALLVSGDTSPETLQAADAAGLRLLHKPVSPLRLRVTVSGLLRSA